MNYRTENEIAALVASFEKLTLTEKEWTHGAHLTVALAYVVRFGEAAATAKMQTGIPVLNESFGKSNTENAGYHETLTVFWARTIAAFAAANHNKSLVELANQLTESYDSSYPSSFYSRELLFSTTARRSFVEPDL